MKAEGHKIGLIVRSEQKKLEAITAIGQSNNIDFFYADLSKQKEVIRVTSELKAKWSSIDGIFNNAGLLLDKAYYSVQDNEMHFEINSISPYLLTKQLKPLLDAATHPFVVNTVTGGMHKQKGIDVADLIRPEKFVKLLGSYMKSKFALLLLMNDLANEWTNTRFLNVAPGAIKTKMTGGEGVSKWLKPIPNILFSSPIKGAQTLYDTAFNTSFHEKSGINITNGKIRPINLKISEEYAFTS